MDTHIDPVCGMKVDDQKPTVQSTYEGRTYYFCGQACKGKFDEDPQQYAIAKAS